MPLSFFVILCYNVHKEYSCRIGGENMETEKIMAVGLELKSGQWKLFENGTLQFIGEGCLFGGIYRSYKNQIRRIEIYGCQEITAFQFSELPFFEGSISGSKCKNGRHRSVF